MSAQPCPHCKQATISWWQKYKAAKWSYIYCPNCQKKLCSHPYVLVAYTMFYVWDLMLFGYLFYLTGATWYLLAMVGCWLILDVFSLYLPLAAMKTLKQT